MELSESGVKLLSSVVTDLYNKKQQKNNSMNLVWVLVVSVRQVMTAFKENFSYIVLLIYNYATK